MRAISSARRPVAACGGADSRPKPSSVSAGASTLASEIGATPADSATSRRSMSTNSPDNGRLDQSALAVTWNSTTRPAPRVACVTSGVPSASAAQVWPARSAEGSASTCRFTFTSSGTPRPANGELALNCATPAGSAQDNAPPSWRSPPSSLTGISGSISPNGCSAVRGPAKRISSPPCSTHLVSASRSAPAGSGRSARISTDTSRCSSVARSASRTSVNGDSARRR